MEGYSSNFIVWNGDTGTQQLNGLFLTLWCTRAYHLLALIRVVLETFMKHYFTFIVFESASTKTKR